MPPSCDDADTAWKFFGVTRLDRADEYANFYAPTHDVYAGVLPRFQRSSLAGSDKDVNAAAWLWCDIDRGAATDAEMTDFLRSVRARLPKPRLIVLSGSGGTHLYWRLLSVVPLPTTEARSGFAAILRRLVVAVGAGPSGIHADKSCTNVSRILRLPGTFNHKHDPARRVEAVVCDDHDELSLAGWDVCLPWEPLPANKTRLRRDEANPLAARSGPPAGLLAWASRGYPEGNRHHDLVAAAAFLRRDTGVAPSVAFELLRIKAGNSPGRRTITDEELEAVWRWAQ